MEVKNLKKAAQRILEAISNKEKIILYGDADLDGVSSVIILKEGIEKLGGKVAAVYFPDREKEGYGINEKALSCLKKYSPALFISLDCGIGNFKEIDLANKMGFEVMIVDHHEILGKLPKASIIVDPKQKDDQYSFKQLACAGVTYKLVKFLLSKKQEWDQPEKFLELVAIATLADQMPLIDENEKLVKEGRLALDYTQRSGLRALMDLSDFKNEDIDEVRSKIISPLNSAQVENHSNQIYLILTENSLRKSKVLAKTLIKNLEEKRKEMKKLFREIEERIEDPSSLIIFEGDYHWPLILLGAIASKICHRYKRPVFLFKKQKLVSQGAVRMPSGMNGVKAMRSCKKFLETYGGHPLAAGFRMKNKDLEKFEKCLIEYFSK